VTSYNEFLASKVPLFHAEGLTHEVEIHPRLFAFQSAIVKWALRRGRSALWADTGLGKTVMQLEWARHVPGRVIILAPLAVSHQTAREASSIGLDVHVAEDMASADGHRVVIVNYEKMHKFDADAFDGVVLDESSIIKSHDGATRNAILSAFARTPFRLACTATPAPNDHVELGNHAEFVGAMTRTEMLSTYFVHDGGDTSKWRLKGHARADFWKWVRSWALAVRHPRDIGHDQPGYDLPPLRMHEHVCDVDVVRAKEGMLFAVEANTLQEQRAERRATLEERVAKAAALANGSDEQWLVWCDLNSESEALTKAIRGAVEVTGSDTDEDKSSRMLGFADGSVRVLVSKPSICGFGMNFQLCHNVAFVGVSHSFEQFYQSTRRCYRFGQKSPVDVHVITASTEGKVIENIKRKHRESDAMMGALVESMTDGHEIGATSQNRDTYRRDVASGKLWTMHNGDCVDVIREVPSESVGYSIFSPPFASLYTYSASDRDMGNARTYDDFAAHFGFLIPELYRVTMPGRLLSYHCMLLPTSKSHDGFIGLRDFRGDLIRMFQSAGWIFHSEVVIWKDPVTAMQRTKALGLLHKTIRKDSAMSRQGIPDYVVTMRKPGENVVPISHAEDLPVQLWQKYASPVWDDINPSDTLQHRSAREHEDERHICPLQLGVIDRCLHLWSRPGDLVLSPFGGIGSEGWCAVQGGRRYLGIELKRSYYEQAVRNLAEASADTRKQGSLFAEVGA
jgi:DNA modification methylase/superfamily II DNA or RNA helicase